MSIAVPLFQLSGEATSTGPDLTRYVLVCLSLLLLILGLAYLFRRFVHGNLKRRAAKRSLQILDALPLGSKQKLLVVRCYDRSFLIGVGDKELCSIAELDGAEEQVAATEGEREVFEVALERAVVQGPPPPTQPEPREAEPPVEDLDTPEPAPEWKPGQGVLA